MEFVKATSFQQANRGPGDIERIVVHTAEIQEHRDSAEDIAAFFSNPGTEVSAHYVVDNDSIIQCVRDEDISFHALGDNVQTLGYELCGFARQTAAQWRDDFSRAMIDLAAKSMAADCKRYGIPVRRLTNQELEEGKRGFVSHKQVSDVFGAGIRSDPGAEFPWQMLFNRVEVHMGGMQKIEFVLTDEMDTRDLKVSQPVKNSEVARQLELDNFLAESTGLIDRELAEDRDVVVRRRKAD